MAKPPRKPHPPIIPAQFTEAQWARVKKAMRLSPTEANILALVLRGRSDKEIEKELDMMHRTLRTHFGVMFRGLDIHDRLSLALCAFAIRDGRARR